MSALSSSSRELILNHTTSTIRECRLSPEEFLCKPGKSMVNNTSTIKLLPKNTHALSPRGQYSSRRLFEYRPLDRLTMTNGLTHRAMAPTSGMRWSIMPDSFLIPKLPRGLKSGQPSGGSAGPGRLYRSFHFQSPVAVLAQGFLAITPNQCIAVPLRLHWRWRSAQHL